MTALRGGVSAGSRPAGAQPGSRREYALGLALGAAGAGVVLLSARQGWARVSTPAPSPLPASVVSVALDCDGDAVLVKVDQAGGVCHTGDRTCFDAGPLAVSVP